MPADFHEVRFPLDVALGSRGGPVRRTEIVTLASGREHRNGRWSDSRRRYDAGLGIRTVDALHAVVAFFEERRGRLYGFRFHDRVDWKSCAPSAKSNAICRWWSFPRKFLPEWWWKRCAPAPPISSPNPSTRRLCNGR